MKDAQTALSDQIPAQDCELEYWLQQADNYAEVQIPADDLRAIIARAYALPGLLAVKAENERMREALQELYNCGCVAIDALDDAPEDVFGEAKAQEFEDALHEARAALGEQT